MGRPRKYTVSEVERKINTYFNKKEVVPNVCGLAVAIGIHRDTLHTWLHENGPYTDTLKNAYQRIEDYWVSRLATKACTGAIFYLKAQCKWQEKQEIDVTHQGNISLNINIKGLKDGATI